MEKQIIKYKGLIYKVLKNIKLKSAEEKERMFQAGLIAVWKALPFYDERKNIKLSTFLTVCIRNGIYTELKKDNKYKYKPLFDVYSYQHSNISEYLPVLDAEEKQYLEYWLEGISVLEISKIEKISYRQASNNKLQLIEKIKRTNKDLV